MNKLFNHEDSFSGTPTLEHIFEGPSDEQVASYIESLLMLPEHITDGRSSNQANLLNPESHPDTKMLNYLQAKYQVETNNPLFDIRSEISQHMEEQNHGKKKRTTTPRLVQGT